MQEALAACGWEEAAELQQQDTSEAFSFISETLQLPLLTLKMDLFHTGTEDAEDDHKFVHERLLEVAIPEDSDDGRPIQLEDCLENYFNNRVEVVRRFERSNTLASPSKQPDIPTSIQEGELQRIETSEHIHSSPVSSTSANVPATPTPTNSGRHRAESIVRRRVVSEEENTENAANDARSPRSNSMRRGTIRKEVLMPAWQMFNLIRPSPISLNMHTFPSYYHPNAPVLIGNTAWYTKSSSLGPETGVAAHFKQTRPVLGICLKRYQMAADGTASRKSTFVDIPVDIGLPHFIQDDNISEDEPLMGSFKLSLQSIICHRGSSVHAGHYISIIRGTTEIADGDFKSPQKLADAADPPQYPEDRWIKFDDLGEGGRVSYVDINQALKDEMPYLLFYQVQPIFDDSPPPELNTSPESETLPPSYTDSGVALKISQSTPELNDEREHHSSQNYFDAGSDESNTPPHRLSIELNAALGSLSQSEEGRRISNAFTETSQISITNFSTPNLPATPATPATPPVEESTTAQRMSRAAARFTKSGSKSQSRAESESGENRISATFSRLSIMRSKDLLGKSDSNKDKEKDESVFSEDAGKTDDGGMIGRSKSIMGRKKEKHKSSPSENSKGESGHHHHHHSLGGKDKGKGKDKDVPERECEVM